MPVAGCGKAKRYCDAVIVVRPVAGCPLMSKSLASTPLTASETKQLAYSVLTDAQKHRFEEHLELDLASG